VFYVGPNSTQPSSYDDKDTDKPIGTQLCYVLSVTPGSSSNPGRLDSYPPACAIIGKRPKTQVWAADLQVKGRVNTSTSTKNSATYGSWAEYGIIASQGIQGAASGAAFAGPGGLPGAPGCNISSLSFTNTNAGSSTCAYATSIGNYKNANSIPDVADSFPGTGNPISGSSIVPSGLPSVVDNTYNANGDITLIQSELPIGKTVVIKAPDNKVIIAGNQTYANGPYKGIGQLPQLIIIAKEIVINQDVTNVDAWLVATKDDGSGSIYTCETLGNTINVCKNPLKVNGPVLTDHLYLYRTAGSDSGATSGDPAEVFNLRADAYLWVMAYASSKGHIQTSYITELPPRF
jgi:hypothetical protein